ncbi:hypothetical protein [Brevibacillus laterosporus]|uniref:Uncharacterized protein n=1 Tax=Brevibacillus laterosporus TaxID=1465 RepID=A0A0F6Y0P1_BRELA|nr:hypothetical protein EX87_19945 [Brevibacillus laterosporus]
MNYFFPSESFRYKADLETFVISQICFRAILSNAVRSLLGGIAEGANDPRVKKEESEQIVAELEEKGLDYEY